MGVRDAKARLSELVRRVKDGEFVEITERGRPVARIIRIDEPKDEYDRIVDNLLRHGDISVRPPKRRPKPMPPMKLPLGVDLQKELREDRDKH